MGFIGTATSASIGWLKHATAAGSTLLNDLVAYWPLDEVSGTRADAVGDNDLTDNNTVGSSLAGPSGTVATFVNANDEYLSKTSLSVGASNTVVMWFKIPAAPPAGQNWILNFGSGTYPASRLAAYYSSTGAMKMEAYYGGAGKLDLTVAAASLPAGSWHMIAMTYDGTSHTPGGSFDGAAVTEGTAAAGDETVNLIWLGWAGATWHWGYEGQMGPAGLWDRKLSDADILALFNSGNGKAYADLTTAEKVGLVSYWNLSEASGDRADSHGSNTLSDNNTVGSVINSGGAMHNAAASFVAGNTEYLSLAGGITVGTTGGGATISVWAKSIAATQYPMLICNGVDGPGGVIVRGLGIYQNNAVVTGRARCDSGDEFDASIGGFTADAWHLVVAWFDPATQKVNISIDNSAPAESAAGASANLRTPEAYSLAVIGGGWGNGYFGGLIDEAAIWSRVLTADERAELYALGAGKFYPFT